MESRRNVAVRVMFAVVSVANVRGGRICGFGRAWVGGKERVRRGGSVGVCFWVDTSERRESNGIDTRMSDVRSISIRQRTLRRFEVSRIVPGYLNLNSDSA